MVTKKINNKREKDGNISLNHPRDLATEKEKIETLKYNADPKNYAWKAPEGFLDTLNDRDVVIAALTLMCLIDARKLSGKVAFSDYPSKLARAEELLKAIK